MLKPAVVLDPTHAVPALRDVLAYVNEHPACTKAELVAALAGTEETKMKETLVQLVWLVEKGHVVEYYNDVLSAPLDYPAFRFLPGEKQAGGQPQRRGGEPAVASAAQPASAAAPAEPVAEAAAESEPAPDAAEAAPAADPADAPAPVSESEPSAASN